MLDNETISCRSFAQSIAEKLGRSMNIDSQSAAGEIPWGRSPFCFLAVVLLALMVSSAQGQIAPDPQTAPAAPASTAHATTDQAPGTPAPMEQVPGISTNADEVSLDLVVKDKKHNAILDLKPEDIEVTDNGTPVKLTGLHLVKADAGTSPCHPHWCGL
jgi:hypothetical protein